MKKTTGLILLAGFVFALGWWGSFFYQKQKPIPDGKEQKDIYLAFINEVYDKIKENYWEKKTDEELIGLFQSGVEKLIIQPQTEKIKDKPGFEKMMTGVLREIKPEKKKEFVVSLADVVLANLKPFGRSRLYTEKEEKELAHNVQNITGTDRYGALGVDKNVSMEEIKNAYKKKMEELKDDESEEGKKKREAVKEAYRVLGDERARKIYDETGAEPTMEADLARPGVLYLKMTKFSPTSLEELKRVTEKFEKTEGLDSLIFDLRDNIGGSIDLLPYFLGPFIGYDQYAYQFFHQGERTDFKTKTGWMPVLVRYKKVVFLMNGETQSTAEVMAGAMKKYNVGVVVGTKTKGWGTVERVFHLENQMEEKERYAIFLAHSLTLRDDGQLIEGNGVEPMINTEAEGWEKELYGYFNYRDLVEAVRDKLKIKIQKLKI